MLSAYIKGKSMFNFLLKKKNKKSPYENHARAYYDLLFNFNIDGLKPQGSLSDSECKNIAKDYPIPYKNIRKQFTKRLIQC